MHALAHWALICFAAAAAPLPGRPARAQAPPARAESERQLAGDARATTAAERLMARLGGRAVWARALAGLGALTPSRAVSREARACPSGTWRPSDLHSLAARPSWPA
jgi:hypothetical protein